MTKWLCWLGLHRWRLLRREVCYRDRAGDVILQTEHCPRCHAEREEYLFPGDKRKPEGKL